MPFAQGCFYTEHDSGPANQMPLVLVHGAGGSCLSWPPGLRRLPGRRVIALDLPGHGKSAGSGSTTIEGYAEALDRWLEGIGLGSVVLAGHSMGGAIALWCALRLAERVAALVLIGTGARMRVHPELLEKSHKAASFKAVVSLVTEWSYSAEAPQNLVRLAARRLSEVSPQVLHADFLACDRFDVRDHLDQVRQPTLVVGGQADRLTPLKYARFLASGLPAARLVVVQGTGHMVMLEKPEEVAAAVEGFLRCLSGDTGGGQDRLA